MSPYAAPLRDMLFTMQEIGGLDAVLAQQANQELSADLVEAILDEASKFAANDSVVLLLCIPADDAAFCFINNLISAA